MKTSVNKNSITPSMSAWLDVFRWVAAFAVVLSHAKHRMIVESWDEVEGPYRHILMKIFYAISDLGHQGVVVFFVMSGFLVGGPLYSKWKNGLHITLGDYLIRRSSRLYLVLLPALFATAIFDWLGYNFLGQTIVYNKFHILLERSDLITFLGNVLFLQEIFVKPYGSNSPLWSLSYEFWYYLIFPLALMSIPTRKLSKVNIASSLLTAFIAFLIFPKILIYMGIWLFGVVVRNSKIESLPFNNWVYFIQFAVVLVLVRLFLRAKYNNTWIEVAWDYIVAFSFCLLLLKLKNQSDRSISFRKVHALLAESSYSLYLFHLPVMNIVVCLMLNFEWVSQMNVQPSFLTLVKMFFLMLFCYLFSLLAYYATERHTNRLHEKIKSFLDVKLKSVRS